MEILKSLRFLIIGVFKRIYWILPTLILDPFEIAEKLLNVSYDVPQWAIWILFAAGWVVAILLTYHELRMQKVALEQPPNWIDAYKARHGKLPLLPDYLRPVCESHPIDQPVSKDMELKTPSGQLWNSWKPTQQEEWRQLVEWCGKNPEDYLAHMRQMLPKTPSGVERIRYRPHDQH